MTYRLIVIGSGPAGVSAATSYLKAGGEGPVLLVSRDADAPYERPPLSKDALREPGEVEGSPIASAQELAGIEVRLGTPVTGIDLDERMVQMGESAEAYEHLIIAAGMQPVPVPNADAEADIHLLRSLGDAAALKQAAMHARTALVIGSGFIGCEAAVSLAR
ncbi:MAG: FAD/NAD(P)-binding oxidoreductase, partial [Propionibacteriaceae bacterium]|nr:FAD/NAD(P)-binding oxidoreductase [Propionibacteriaceae bacterium]